MQTLSIFTGEDIRNFTDMTDEITHWIENTFVQDKEPKALVGALRVWKEIASFLRRTKIYDNNKTSEEIQKSIEEYKESMQKFKKNVKDFYSFGVETFLTKYSPGDMESFYCHVLRFYMDDIVKDTWETHNLGVGIFTMQGFERRNKESKYTLQYRTNNKGNIMVQNLIRLCAYFLNIVNYKH